MHSTLKWEPSTAEAFWQKEGSGSHVVQIYETETEFLNLLKDFVQSGLTAGEAVILIAKPEHLTALEKKLAISPARLKALKADNLYLPLEASEVLSRFMVNDWPDYILFMKTIAEIFAKARQGNRPVRAFGEMVAVLWEQGKNGSTIMVEQLWNMYCEKEPITLFCAYPKSEFPEGSTASLQHICKHHSKIISGKNSPAGELKFQQLN